MTAADAVIAYDFGGLRVHSTLRLPGVTPLPVTVGGDDSPDIDITLAPGALPPAGDTVHRWDGRYALELDARDGGWLVRRGQDVAVSIDAAGRTFRCHCPDPTRLPFLADVLVRRLLPRAGSLHGRLPIHAATLGDPEGAVMLFGASGAGKSTLTAALALGLGWDILSDDMSVLSPDADRTVWPTMPGVSLWEASRQGLDLPAADCEPLHSYEGKIWYAPHGGRTPAPRPLVGLIFLSIAEPGAPIAWARQSGPKVLVMAASQLVRFNPRDPAETKLQLDQLNALVAAAPAYTLSYPRDFKLLPHVLEAVRSLRADALDQRL